MSSANLLDITVDTSVSTNGKAKNKRAASNAKTQTQAKRVRTSTPTNDVATPSRAQGGENATQSSESTLADDNNSPATSLEARQNPHTPPPPDNVESPTGQSDTQGETQSDFSHVDYVPLCDLERLVAFARKVDEQNNRFAVSRVPASARWGSSSTTDRTYCYNDRPITYWLLGVVGSKWFTNFKGEPQLRVNIGLRLPYKDDDAFAKKIYKLASPPKKDDDIPELVYASKYMARQVRGSADAVPMPFKDVYDAQRRFRSKREMSIIPPAYISKNNIVLVEAFLTRWSTSKDKKNKAEWTSWDVGFELQAVSLLFEAPPAVDEHEYGPADNIRDDM